MTIMVQPASEAPRSSVTAAIVDGQAAGSKAPKTLPSPSTPQLPSVLIPINIHLCSQPIPFIAGRSIKFLVGLISVQTNVQKHQNHL